MKKSKSPTKSNQSTSTQTERSERQPLLQTSSKLSAPRYLASQKPTAAGQTDLQLGLPNQGRIELCRPSREAVLPPPIDIALQTPRRSCNAYGISRAYGAAFQEAAPFTRSLANAVARRGTCVRSPQSLHGLWSYSGLVVLCRRFFIDVKALPHSLIGRSK